MNFVKVCKIDQSSNQRCQLFPKLVNFVAKIGINLPILKICYFFYGVYEVSRNQLSLNDDHQVNDFNEENIQLLALLTNIHSQFLIKSTIVQQDHLI